MTALDLIPDEELAREPVKEPAKRWRNWWVAIVAGNDGTSSFRPGDIIKGLGTYPSKEVAEQAALEIAAQELAEFGFNADEYLGAFPEGERP